jgi:quinol monooxygenase YgiN
MIVIAGSVQVKSGKADVARQAALRMAEATRAEAGCITYRFSTDLVDPDRVYIFEEWESEEALGRHFASPHMAEFQRVLPEVLGGPADIKLYQVSAVRAM